MVLLHGLIRSSGSMRPLERRLEREGYRVVNIGYPSTRLQPDSLVEHFAAELAACCASPTAKVHFVTHSMGGLLVRALHARAPIDSLGRVVMLAPPNGGSEIVDRLGGWWLFRKLLGAAGQALGTDSAAWPAMLPPVDFEVGIIAGRRSLNPLFSALLPGPDDGTISVASTRIDGAADFLVVRHSHTLIMRSERVHDQVVAFLRTGRFTRSP